MLAVPAKSSQRYKHMGYLTTITIHNDALGSFEKDPKAFGEAIFRGINEANLHSKQVSVPFGCYANYITVEYSKHADHDTVYLHSGNGVNVIGEFDPDFKKLVKSAPDVAIHFIKIAKRQIKYAETLLKKKSLTKA